MNAALNKKIRFGDITLDPQSNLINVVGKEKRLEPKLVSLLVYLAQHPQQVITRQQITETIWPSVVVGEESITQAIFALRNALGDDAKHPKYIETIPKKGYRFLMNTVEAEQPTESLITPKAPQRFWLSLGVLASVILIGLVAWLFPHTDYEIDSVLPVTKMPGTQCCMAVRDHKMAFINITDTSSNDIYLKDLTSGIQERITKDTWRKNPVSWLDDNTIIYPRCSDTECQIVQQGLHNSPQVIYTTPHYIYQLALIPNNPSMFVFNEQKDTSSFITYDLRSGKMISLHQQYPNLPPSSVAPQFSQDAQQLYFLVFDQKPSIMRLDFATQKITTITDQFDEITNYSLNAHDQLIITGTHQSISGLWSLNANDEPRLILRSSGDEKLLFPVEQDHSIYYLSARFDRDINAISDNNDLRNELTTINSTGIDELATSSDDEQFIYFVSTRSGYAEVWRHDQVRHQTKQITHVKAASISTVLPSHDGQRLSVMYTYNAQPMMGVFSMHTGELLGSISSLSYPLSWSQDDKYIYVKDYNDNVPVLSRYDSQTLARKEIQQNAGLIAQESNNQQSLLFIDFAKNALIERNLATGHDETLIHADFALDTIGTGRLRLDTTNTSMFVVKPDQNSDQLWQYPFTASPQKVMDLPPQIRVTYINSIGTQLLFDKEMPPSGNIMKIELKK